MKDLNRSNPYVRRRGTGSPEELAEPCGTDFDLARKNSKRRVRLERVRTADGRVGEAWEWTEDIEYDPDIRVGLEVRRALDHAEGMAALRGCALGPILFVAMCVGWDQMGGPLWLWFLGLAVLLSWIL